MNPYKRLEGYQYTDVRRDPRVYFQALQQQQKQIDEFNKLRSQPVKQRGKGGFLSSIISELGGAGGAAGGAALGASIGSVVPVLGTAVGGLIGAGIGGFAGGTGGRLAENKIRDNRWGVGDALKEGTLSGALSVVGGGASALKGAKAVKALKGASALGGNVDEVGKIAKAGNSLRAGIVNPKVAASPFGATKEAGVVNTLNNLGLKGSAKNQYQKLPGVMTKLNSQIDTALTSNTNTSSLSKLTGSIKKTSKDLPQFINGDPTYTKSLVNELGDLNTKFTSNKVTAAQLQKAKTELSGKMGNIFTKVAKGADLNPKEASRLAIWKGLDDHIVKVAPEVKALTSQQAKLYEAAPGLLASSKKTMGIPLLGVKSGGAERIAQGGQDLVGRGLQRMGGVRPIAGAKGMINSIPGAAPVMKQAKFQAPGNLVEALTSPGMSQEDQMIQEAQSMDPNMIPKAEDYASQVSTYEDAAPEAQNPYPQEALMADIQRDPKNADDYMKLYSMFAKQNEIKAPKALSSAAKQQNALVGTGLNAISNLRSMFQKDPSLIAKTGVPGRNVLGIGNRVLGLGEYEAMAQQAIDSVARLRTGAAMTPSEETFYRRMVPQAGDSEATINQKLDELERYFGSFQNSPEMSGEATPDLMEALMAQQGAY